jgi:two-component system LytT family sensor kinase
LASSPFAQRRFLLLYTAWWMIWTGLQAWTVTTLGVSLSLSLEDSLVSNLILAGACLLVSNNLRFYLPQQQRYGYLLLQTVLITGGWLFAVRFSLSWLIKDNPAYLAFLASSLPVRYAAGFLVTGGTAILSVMWYSFEDRSTVNRRKRETEALAREAELYKLRQQLQPHFLFNSLNSINALIGSRPEEARKMVQQLSDFLRGTLKQEEQQWVTVENEFRYLQLYLDIEKVRFGNRLLTRILPETATLLMELPAMLLQPVLENAIKFGLYDTLGEICIEVSTTVNEGLLEVNISNPYDGDTIKSANGTGFGLSSVKRRLYLLFARHDLLETTAKAGIFRATLRIPPRKEIIGPDSATS